MLSKNEFQNIRLMLIINTFMLFSILCIMIWVAVMVNTTLKDVQKKVNMLQKPVSNLVTSLKAPVTNFTNKVKDIFLNNEAL